MEGGNIYFDLATGAITGADESITAAYIPAEINGVAVTSVDYEAFSYCVKLVRVTIPNSVTNISECAFYGCHSLTDVNIPDSVTNIGDNVFLDCWSLTSVKIPSSVTSIGSGMFMRCSGLTNVTVQNGVTGVADQTFYMCTNLTSIAIPDSVTSIGEESFYWCLSLTDVTIPESVTSIGKGAFKMTPKSKSASSDDSPNLVSVTVKNPNCEIYADAETLGLAGTTIIYGYAGSTAEDYAEEYGFEFVAIKDVHEHTTKIQNAKEANCIEAGYTGDEVCTECGETVKTGIVIPAKGHTWGAWISNKDATTEKDGTKTRDCSVCGVKETVTDTGSKLPAPTDPKPTDPMPSTPWTNPYSDVKSSAWYYDSVSFATQRGLFFGTSDATFSPDGKMTRAMLVAVLYRLEGSSKASGNMPFTDVPSTEYYYDAVKWATANGIVYGTSADKFSPNANVTREQMVTFLYRYAKYKGIDVSSEASLSAFPDANRISNYAKSPFAWSVGADVIHGSDGKLLPGGTATRAEVATMLRFFVVNIVEK